MRVLVVEDEKKAASFVRKPSHQANSQPSLFGFHCWKRGYK